MKKNIDFIAVKGKEEFPFIQEMLKEYPVQSYGNGSVIMTVPKDDKILHLTVGSQQLKDYINMCFFELANRFPNKNTLTNVESWLRYKVMTQEPKNINYRVKRIDDTIYYDLCNDKGEYLKITKNGYELLQGNTSDYFAYNPNQSPQVIPVIKDGKIELLRKYVNISDEDWLLFIVYLISCFYGGIQHPVLNINGVYGSGKSTVSKIVKSLVDPSLQLLNDLPRQERDLVVTLTSTYYIVFDNLSKLTPEKSDIICKAVTGGNASLRELYTMTNLRNIPYNTLIALNGISDVIYRGDLAQRTIYIETLIIDEEKRRPENEFWKEFEKDKPYILGCIFNILSKAIGLYDTVTVRKLHRLADFHKLGCAIAKAIDPSLEAEFNKALIQNKMKQANNTLNNNVMLNALFDYLKKYQIDDYTGSMSELYLDVREFIQCDYKQQYELKYFPKAANAFGKSLRGYIQLCKDLGLIVDIYKDPKSGNSHVHISKKQEEQENEAEQTEEVVIGTENKVVERHAIFERTPIVERHAIFERTPIFFNKSERVLYSAQQYKNIN